MFSWIRRRFRSDHIEVPGRVAANTRPWFELRVPDASFTTVRLHVEDFRHGEEVGFLVCSIARRSGAVTLLAREWHPIPSRLIRRDEDGYVSSWPAELNSVAAARAITLGGTLVLIHSHGPTHAPVLSPPDLRNADELFPPLSRLLDGRPTGSVVLGEKAASGRFWQDGAQVGELSKLVVVGAPIDTWLPKRKAATPVRARLARQNVALGIETDALLASASVAVIGTSGGGSHACQQLAFAGVGRIVPIDGQLVERVNRGRMVGSEEPDVDNEFKVDVMERMIGQIDPNIRVQPIPERFPSPATLDALKSVDVVVACVDRFDVRAQINAFCRRHHLPLVDVGLNIETDDEGQLSRAYGQVIVVLPDSPCMQCTPLLSDAVLAWEKRERPPGYDLNPDATGDPQVVSMNGTLASEAVNIVLDLITGFSAGARGAGWWQYDGRGGALYAASLPPHRADCPACAEAAHGDPAFASR
jgi:molybdopterin/thiamine biosynthesis adenylyltransferase